MSRVAVGLGSNKGDRLANIRRALKLIRERAGVVVAASDVFETPPWGVAVQPRFLNACVLVDVELPPHDLLAKFKEIEYDMGRLKKGGRWGPREIDIDILLYDDVRINDKDLTIPHQYMHERAFVLMPLSEIATELTHPASGLSISDLLAASDSEGIIRIACM
ncbi:MAG: 2-amino-4-hydroxy-6-hydroxymethyldihydropteridine diphosphokinase [Synergistaceae bacterium]|jgi:2-amino-4-hydroxy-6-hydroxymethyldihydropteridine diphosphokinase|nr:2-amino-4-hydroxy-6-hydroxymethyldihydropteridine diphosphokinase [Synergistaceae bacterium]